MLFLIQLQDENLQFEQKYRSFKLSENLNLDYKLLLVLEILPFYITL